MKKELQDAREEYKKLSLDETRVAHDPIDQFNIWLEQYKSLQVKDYNAMLLTTVSPENIPSSRVVLLKGVDRGGFEFFTNYESQKARDIASNPLVALNFYWPELERQIRISGVAHKLEPAESDQYFSLRPRGNQIGAWVSPQSHKIEGRLYLEERLTYFEKKFNGEIPRPEHWGGYRVYPETIEFWQGRENRLHDRILYEKSGGDWKTARLAP